MEKISGQGLRELLWGVVALVMTPLFLMPTWKLFRHRKKYPINSRSPLLACIGCVALYCDSVVNIVIMILKA